MGVLSDKICWPNPSYPVKNVYINPSKFCLERFERTQRNHPTNQVNEAGNLQQTMVASSWKVVTSGLWQQLPAEQTSACVSYKKDRGW